MTNPNDDDAIAKGVGTAVQRHFWQVVAFLMALGVGWLGATAERDRQIDRRLMKVECRLQMEACK